MAVLVAPGNGGNRLGRADLAEELRRRGLAVLLMDYRGYGGNPGDPSEDGLARDAVAAAEALEDLGFPPERTIYFGESLGTGVVARAAVATAACRRRAAVAVHRVRRCRVRALPVAAGAPDAARPVPRDRTTSPTARCR